MGDHEASTWSGPWFLTVKAVPVTAAMRKVCGNARHRESRVSLPGVAPLPLFHQEQDQSRQQERENKARTPQNGWNVGEYAHFLQCSYPPHLPSALVPGSSGFNQQPSLHLLSRFCGPGMQEALGLGVLAGFSFSVHGASGPGSQVDWPGLPPHLAASGHPSCGPSASGLQGSVPT